MTHDQNYKNLILDYPLQALRLFAADEADALGDDVRITPIRQEQFQERLGERFRELDVPLLVEWPDGRREALLFVLEEETDAGRFSIHRLAHYSLDLAFMFKTERVVPVVIFLKGSGHAAKRLDLGGERHTFLAFHYLACDLAALPYEQYRDSDNIVARLNLPNMHYAPQMKLEAYAKAVQGLQRFESDIDKQAKYVDFIDIYAGLDDNERERYRREYPQEVDFMSSFADRFRQEGLQQGVQQGMQQGEARVLLRQLQRKFGDLPEAIQRRVEQADERTLLEWSERVLTASRLDEVVH